MLVINFFTKIFLSIQNCNWQFPNFIHNVYHLIKSYFFLNNQHLSEIYGSLCNFLLIPTNLTFISTIYFIECLLLIFIQNIFFVSKITIGISHFFNIVYYLMKLFFLTITIYFKFTYHSATFYLFLIATNLIFGLSYILLNACY